MRIGVLGEGEPSARPVQEEGRSLRAIARSRHVELSSPRVGPESRRGDVRVRHDEREARPLRERDVGTGIL